MLSQYEAIKKLASDPISKQEVLVAAERGLGEVIDSLLAVGYVADEIIELITAIVEHKLQERATSLAKL